MEAELEVAERQHAELLGRLRTEDGGGADWVTSQLRVAESNARIDAKLARGLLVAHQRQHKNQN